MARNQLILSAFFFNPQGDHRMSWRHPRAPGREVLGFDYYRELVQAAERARIDTIFVADHVSIWDSVKSGVAHYANARLEPLTLLSALAGVTKHIGLITTASSSYSEPYNVARLFASLDHISGGRASWNVVTSAMDEEARNFGRDGNIEHAFRYQRAAEFLDIVKGLWDSWDDDAFVFDKAEGRFFVPERMHLLNHASDRYKVRGPLPVARSPQGHPVIVQAGSSESGRAAATGFADVIFTAQSDLAGAVEFYADMKTRASAIGRDPDHLVVLPGVTPVVAPTRAEAEDKYAALQDLIHPVAGVAMLSAAAGADLSALSPDDPLPPVPETEGDKTRQALLVAHARETGKSIRDLYRWLASGYNTVIGTPADIADHFEQWFESRAADGFNVRFSSLPNDLDDFVELVVPELQKRGLFQTSYVGKTLRENLGLPRPPSRYSR